jgi:hypothetical protein
VPDGHISLVPVALLDAARAAFLTERDADHVIAAINWVAFIAPGAPANWLRSRSSGITARRNWWQRGHHTCISNP